MIQLSHPHLTTGKTIALTIWTFLSKVMSLLSNMLSRLVITFLPRSKRLLISWLQSPSTEILESRKIKVSHGIHCFPIYLPWSDGTGCPDLCFLNVWVLSRLFHSPLSPFLRGSVVSLFFLPLGYHLHIWTYWYFYQQSWFQLVSQFGPAFHMMYSA